MSSSVQDSKMSWYEGCRLKISSFLGKYWDRVKEGNMQYGAQSLS